MWYAVSRFYIRSFGVVKKEKVIMRDVIVN